MNSILKRYIQPIDKLKEFSIPLLILIHLIGLLGLLSPWHFYFQALTPFSLIISSSILLINHKEFNSNFFSFILFVFCLGFLVEFAGVNYGFLFGDYQYGQTLGFKILNVPVIIGLNWVLIIYSVIVFLDRLVYNPIIKIVFGSLLAVFLDVLIEPVAVHYDFWFWKTGTIPIQNYVGWFATSLVMMSAYYLLKVKAANQVARPLYIIQVLFFLFLNLGLRLF
jgi:bisanhydrobacterioruberin hydratase